MHNPPPKKKKQIKQPLPSKEKKKETKRSVYNTHFTRLEFIENYKIKRENN